MLVTPPGTPSRRTGKLDALLDSLGFPVIDDLDEESESIVDAHDDLFEEVSAFARRGWVSILDCNTGFTYSAKAYADELRAILRPLGVATVKYDDKGGFVFVDKIRYQVDVPSQIEANDDWLDGDWILEVANRAVGEAGSVLAVIYDAGVTILAVVSHSVWTAVNTKQLQGSWLVLPPVEHAFD